MLPPKRTIADRALVGTDADGDLVLRRALARVVAGPDEGRQATLERDPLIVGSGDQCGLRLSDARVSRCHIELSFVGEGVRVQDLGSQSGTFFGESRIHSSALPVGSRIRIGESTIELTSADETISVGPCEATAFGDLRGTSGAMRRLFATLERIQTLTTPLLIVGEDGVGKTAIALALHAASGKTGDPHVFDLALPADWTTIAPALANEEATVILDNVDRIDSAGVRAFRSILEERERSGQRARVISTARDDPRAMVETGEFSQDLYFQVASLRLVVPPLRERLEDVVFLGEHFAGGGPLPATEIADLRERGFPGNVRELRAVVEAGPTIQM